LWTSCSIVFKTQSPGGTLQDFLNYFSLYDRVKNDHEVGQILKQLIQSIVSDMPRGSLRADVSYFLPPAEKGRLRNGVANRVPVSCCSGFKFRINYDNTVLLSVPESFPSDRSMIGGRTGLRGGI